MGNLKTEARLHDGKIITVSLSVVQANKTFGLLSRDLINEGVYHSEEEKLPPIKGFIATMSIKPDSKPMFCATRRVPMAYEKEISEEFKRLESMGIIERYGNEGVKMLHRWYELENTTENYECALIIKYT